MKTNLKFLCVTFILFLMNNFNIYAQGDPFDVVNNTLQQNQSGLKSIFDNLKPYALGAAGLVLLIGVVQVGSKIQKGDREAAEKMGWWFGSIIFIFLALALIPPLFFGSSN